MGFSWGAALQSAGRNIPSIYKSFADAEQMRRDQLRQAQIDDENRKRALLDDEMKRFQIDAFKRDADIRASKYDREKSAYDELAKYVAATKDYGVGDSMSLPANQYESVEPTDYGIGGLGKLKSSMQPTRELPTIASGDGEIELPSDYKQSLLGNLAQYRDNEAVDKFMDTIGVGSGPKQLGLTRLALTKAWQEEQDPDKKKKIFEQLMYTGAPGVYYGLTPEGISKSTDKATSIESATSPIKTRTSANTALAVGGAEALTPEFKQKERAKWESKTKDFQEAAQQYSLGSNSGDNAVGDVALINALEKVREINSAVMFGDYQKWQKAGTIWDKLITDGAIDASTSNLRGRLTTEYRAQIRTTLDKLFANRQEILRNAHDSQIEIAKNDYGWDDSTINRIYKIPSFGMSEQKQPTANSTSAIPVDSDKKAEDLLKKLRDKKYGGVR